MIVPRALLARWVLVLLVGAGVIAMHSLMDLPGCSGGVPRSASALSQWMVATGGIGMSGVAVAPGEAEVSGGTPPTAPADQGDSSMLGHLCLAVLDAFGFLVLVALLLTAGFRTAPGRVTSRCAEGTGQSRAPPADRPPNRLLLTGLCISRR